MKYTYAQLESALSLAMMEEALQNPSIKIILSEISAQLQSHILSVIREKESSGLPLKLESLAMQHSRGDKFIGALLPECTSEYLERTPQGRELLINTLDNCLQNAEKLSTAHEFLALMKSIDGMAFMHDVFATEMKDSKHLLCKSYLAPTVEETAMRSRRPETVLAKTYGIGTESGIDLIKNETESQACLSGKARFFISPPEHRFQTWFEKLAAQSHLDKPSLPLIASPSNATAKNFMMANGLELFKQQDGSFDFDKAQIFANCIMAYLVYCGHHSFLEVAEMWNRQLDFLAIEKPEQLPKGTIPESPTVMKYWDESNAVERKLPYLTVGDYTSFLNQSYAQKVMERAQDYLTKSLDLSFEGSHNAVPPG